MSDYLPWIFFIGSAAAAGSYLSMLPEIFARRRWGGKPGVEGRLLWACLASIASLVPWPFILASGQNREPSVFSVILTTGGALFAAVLLRHLVGTVLAAYLGPAIEEDDPIRLHKISRAVGAATALLLIAFTAFAYFATFPRALDDFVWCATEGFWAGYC